MKLGEHAKQFKIKQYADICDVKAIPVDTEIYTDGKGTTTSGEEFTYSYIMDGENEVRIPKTVIAQLREHLTNNAMMKYFKVARSGSGLNTTYTVIPVTPVKEETVK